MWSVKFSSEIPHFVMGHDLNLMFEVFAGTPKKTYSVVTPYAISEMPNLCGKCWNIEQGGSLGNGYPFAGRRWGTDRGKLIDLWMR